MAAPPDLNTLSLDELFHQLVSPEHLRGIFQASRTEDLGAVGDVTTALVIDADRTAEALLIAREAGCVSGLRTIPSLIKSYQSSCTLAAELSDGDALTAGTAVGSISGTLHEILGIERPLLNVLGHLSGIASLTARFVAAVAGTGVRICDTRKTTPGWRGLEKYAVRCGGGHLHRVGLHDAVLIKDNHFAGVSLDELTGFLNARLMDARRQFDLRFIQVEVDSLHQLDAVMKCEKGLIDLILLDNFPFEDLREAVARRNAADPALGLEASGGVSLDTVRAIAETGVDRISVGALTHSAPALDLGLDIT